MENNRLSLLGMILLSIGILGGGYFIGKGIYYSRPQTRTITVKGIAETNVKSNLGVWDLNYRELGVNLIQINQKLSQDQLLITNFLKQQGFNESDISLLPIKIEDRLANVYNQSENEATKDKRYVVTGGLRVRSADVDLVQRTLPMTNQLLQQGLGLTFDASGLNPNPSFFFTELDPIRPSMLAQATQSARSVASQFARDSGSELNGIQRASQGVFQIMGRDGNAGGNDYNSAGSIEKTVRLVTTIEYRLK